MPYDHVHSRPVSVALVQMSCKEAKQPNVEKALARIAEAARRGANIVCLQELFTGPYFCQTEDHRWFAEAEPIPGPTSEALAAAAKKHGVVVIGTAVIFDADGSQAGVYRKMHIPDDPLYYEKFYFTPGDLGFQSFPTKFGRVGVCVCWDQWYPEAARLTALSGAEIIFYPTAIGWLPQEKAEFGVSQHNAWETMMRSHAIANGVFIAAPNRVGQEGALQFWGASFIADPNGNLIAKSGHESEEILLAQCDLGLIDVVRTHWPFLRDRRIDAYGDLTKRYRDSQ
jgi:N-carbamoylputrescine amidase